ncbi:hypothetical protein RQP46_001043 [Phenoliferia psychrophenolica]
MRLSDVLVAVVALFASLRVATGAPVKSKQQLSGWGLGTLASESAPQACHGESQSHGVLVSPSTFSGGQACGITVFVASLKNGNAGGQIMAEVIGVCDSCAASDLQLVPQSFAELSGTASRSSDGGAPVPVPVRWGLIYMRSEA